MAVPSTPETISGRVVSVNPKGLKLDGHDGWLNFSKFAVDLVPPMRGQHVTLTLDRQGYIRAVTGADGPQEPATGRQGNLYAGVHKDRTITRLAVLKAAAEFAASRPQLKSGDVLTIAASWERWVNRAESADETVDAF